MNAALAKKAEQAIADATSEYGFEYLSTIDSLVAREGFDAMVLVEGIGVPSEWQRTVCLAGLAHGQTFVTRTVLAKRMSSEVLEWERRDVVAADDLGLMCGGLVRRLLDAGLVGLPVGPRCACDAASANLVLRTGRARYRRSVLLSIPASREERRVGRLARFLLTGSLLRMRIASRLGSLAFACY